ncbi:MAG: zinc-ribbon domain-containing protein [Chloroflexi bacterium]|nr:zinc-ribbon domain-containing protein [Chloroflexota bacterium]
MKKSKNSNAAKQTTSIDVQAYAVCTKCGKTNVSNANYCQECGASMAEI